MIVVHIDGHFLEQGSRNSFYIFIQLRHFLTFLAAVCNNISVLHP